MQMRARRQPRWDLDFVGRLSTALNGLPRDLHPQLRAPTTTTTELEGSQTDFEEAADYS